MLFIETVCEWLPVLFVENVWLWFPLLFKDKSDYDKIECNDTISTINLKDFDNKTNLKLSLNKPDGSSVIIDTLHTFSENQIGWFKAGSALNLIAKKSNWT